MADDHTTRDKMSWGWDGGNEGKPYTEEDVIASIWRPTSDDPILRSSVRDWSAGPTHRTDTPFLTMFTTSPEYRHKLLDEAMMRSARETTLGSRIRTKVLWLRERIGAWIYPHEIVEDSGDLW